MPSSHLLHRAHEIDALASSHLLTPNPKLTHALSNSLSAGLPAITVNPLQGQFLALQCKLLGAKSVLEIGTLGGYSTLWFTSTGARVTSIEIDAHHRDVAIRNTRGEDVDVILGDAATVLPRMVDEGRKFDLVFVDAAWEEQGVYFGWAVRLTRKGGVVYVDNVVRALLECEDLGNGEGGSKEGEQGGGLLEIVGGMKGKGVHATLISTVSGWKGKEEEMMDGFLLAVVE